MRAAVLVTLLCIATKATAVIITVEPDDFSVGTDIADLYPGVTLSVADDPGATVQSIDGFSSFNGRNLASTGTLLFGQAPIHSASVPQGWDEFNGLLRADFARPTDFVQIDIIFDDDDFGRLRAFDMMGSLLETVFVAGDGRDPAPFDTALITRPSPDIAYIVVGGDLGEALMLDNLQFNLVAPEPTTFALIGLGLAGLAFARRRMISEGLHEKA